ncbi:MAG: aminoglycoside phosphotransferase family protein [Caldilineaceae bacterium]|nr:aminoglycoside phosphotransferase family protein [Caldilineaceae bacterium]
MTAPVEPLLREALAWCVAQLGPCRLGADASNAHPDARATLARLHTPHGICFLKVHRDAAHWAGEVHAYEHWSAAFGDYAPQLLAVRADPPLALVVTALPGRPLEEAALEPAQQRRAWQAAGTVLGELHGWQAGSWFGSCRRDGAPLQDPIDDPCVYFRAQFEDWLARAARIDSLSGAEEEVVHAAIEHIPLFAGERPVPCHYDYCPPNWLVDAHGALTGVIDFEFSRWDVRVTDFARLPGWEWMARPDLFDAFVAGYGRAFAPRELIQLRVARVLYALGAIVWGNEYNYFGFAAEGRQALQQLASEPW